MNGREEQRHSVIANPLGVAVFLAIAFGASWLWLAVAIVWCGWSVINPVVQLPMAFAPAVAAVVVRRWVTGEGFADAGLAPRWRASWRTYLLAWWGPLLLVAASVGVAAAMGLWRPDSAASEPDSWPPLAVTVPALLVVVVVLTPVYWGEEFGWTGYLRLRLFPDRPLASVTATGLVWALWHYPLALLGYIHFGNIVAGLAIWTLSFLFQEVILAWLYLRARTIWAASLAHAGNNMVLSLLVGLLLAEQLGDTMVTVVMAVPLGVVAAWIVATGRLRPGGLPRRRRGPAEDDPFGGPDLRRPVTVRGTAAAG
ncbi:CPBP family intramembrane glutamic endopeptidase [Nocardia huaxiensis]|uniref:CPBP family intramembrane glutamic endopeptidase n=1 Tax=Nocardia huaxiensis TaxID=2755382 RepID=UPI001C675333|nr:CPBP family intramembrane glutamic endopeptidase [Nocardia huaxiensis]